MKDHKNVYRWRAIAIYIVIPIFIALIFLYSIFISDISTCVNAISKTRLWILAFSFVYVLWASSHDKCFILNSRNYLLVLKPHVSFAAWMFTRFKCRIMTYFKVYSMCNFKILLSFVNQIKYFSAYHMSKYRTLLNMFALIRQSLR